MDIKLESKIFPFPYHIVETSPWPLLTSFALLIFAVSGVLFFQGFIFSGYSLLLGFFLTAFGMIFWFKDVTFEGTYLGSHTQKVQGGLTLGVALFIISEVFAFLSVFWAYFHSSLSPAIEIAGTWPPQGIDALNPFGIPLLNTILLLSSGGFITYGHHALIAGDRSGAVIGIFITIILAILFTYLQFIEYNESAFSFADSVYGSCFYASTGLHGIHVIIGTLFILAGFIRLVLYHLTDTHHLGLEAAILY